MADSIHPEGGQPARSDSAVAGVHWYRIARNTGNDTMRFFITAADSAGNVSRSPLSGWHQVVFCGVSGRPAPALPTCYALGRAYPNPGNGACEISYQTPAAGRVELAVYNLAGQLVKTLERGTRQPGYHQARWDGRDQRGRRVSAGVYIFRLCAGEFSRIGKLVVIR